MQLAHAKPSIRALLQQALPAATVPHVYTVLLLEKGWKSAKNSMGPTRLCWV